MTANEYITKISKLMAKFEEEYPEEFTAYLDTVYQTKTAPQLVKDANDLIVETEASLQTAVVAYVLEHKEPVPVDFTTRDLLLHYMEQDETVNHEVYGLISEMDPETFMKIFKDYIDQMSSIVMGKINE